MEKTNEQKIIESMATNEEGLLLMLEWSPTPLKIFARQEILSMHMGSVDVFSEIKDIFKHLSVKSWRMVLKKRDVSDTPSPEQFVDFFKLKEWRESGTDAERLEVFHSFLSGVPMTEKVTYLEGVANEFLLVQSPHMNWLAEALVANGAAIEMSCREKPFLKLSDWLPPQSDSKEESFIYWRRKVLMSTLRGKEPDFSELKKIEEKYGWDSEDKLHMYNWTALPQTFKKPELALKRWNGAPNLCWALLHMNKVGESEEAERFIKKTRANTDLGEVELNWSEAKDDKGRDALTYFIAGLLLAEKTTYETAEDAFRKATIVHRFWVCGHEERVCELFETRLAGALDIIEELGGISDFVAANPTTSRPALFVLKLLGLAAPMSQPKEYKRDQRLSRLKDAPVQKALDQILRLNLINSNQCMKISPKDEDWKIIESASPELKESFLMNFICMQSFSSDKLGVSVEELVKEEMPLFDRLVNTRVSLKLRVPRDMAQVIQNQRDKKCLLTLMPTQVERARPKTL